MLQRMVFVLLHTVSQVGVLMLQRMVFVLLHSQVKSGGDINVTEDGVCVATHSQVGVLMLQRNTLLPSPVTVKIETLVVLPSIGRVLSMV
jgi:hypothetical protein